jgi:preprotein translocase subunit Sec63
MRLLIAAILAASQLAESYNHHGRGSGKEQEQDHYAVLGLHRGASDNEIKRAYHKLAQKWYA